MTPDNNYKILSFDDFSEDVNNQTFTDYYYRLMLIARSMFRWHNLPPHIDEKWIEKYLFLYGKCMFFDNDKLGLMVAKCNEHGVNEYDEPTKLRPIATNFRDRKEYKNGKECVLIRNNDDRIPTIYPIKLFAWRLAEISRTIDINIEAQQTPVLIKGSDKQAFSLRNIYKKWKGHAPVIFGDKSLDEAAFTVFRTDAPIVFDKLQIQKHAIWNEAMTFLGINNANMDKRERLVDDEVQANNEQVEMSAHVMLKSRERSAEEINRLFGLKVSVTLRTAEEIKSAIGKEALEE